MTQQIQQGSLGKILSEGRTFERVYTNGTIHYFQTVLVLDGYTKTASRGAEGRVAITHEVEIEVDPPENPLLY